MLISLACFTQIGDAKICNKLIFKLLKSFLGGSVEVRKTFICAVALAALANIAIKIINFSC
jgi:hypothetical protein